LTTSAEFQALFHRGKRIERPSFLVLWREVESGRRVGFAVSRRLRRAVDRNRIRRRLREAYRAARSAAPEAVAVIVIGKQRALDVEFGTLVSELRSALAATVTSRSTVGTER
jgi:ribonuclease P protein component